MEISKENRGAVIQYLVAKLSYALLKAPPGYKIAKLQDAIADWRKVHPFPDPDVTENDRRAKISDDEFDELSDIVETGIEAELIEYGFSVMRSSGIARRVARAAENEMKEIFGRMKLL